MASKFYAVKKGRNTGIFHSWEECKAQTAGFAGAIYKSFPTAQEAAEYLGWTGQAPAEKKDCQLKAYVDGSYNVVTKEYGSGAVILGGEQEVHLYRKGDDGEMALMRNVAGEIEASKMAMEYAAEHGYESIEIFHDYEGIARWCLGEWKTNKEGTRQYKDTYEQYRKVLRIEFTKVKGHSGDHYNDVADSLAKKAVGLE